METPETLNDASSSSTLYTHLYSGPILPNGWPGLLPPSHTLRISTKRPPSYLIKTLQRCPNPLKTKPSVFPALFLPRPPHLCLPASFSFFPAIQGTSFIITLVSSPRLLSHLFYYLNILSIKSNTVHLFICLYGLASSPMKLNLHESWAQSVLFCTFFSLSRTEPGTQPALRTPA